MKAADNARVVRNVMHREMRGVDLASLAKYALEISGAKQAPDHAPTRWQHAGSDPSAHWLRRFSCLKQPVVCGPSRGAR